jgi:hypothetical protein
MFQQFLSKVNPVTSGLFRFSLSLSLVNRCIFIIAEQKIFGRTFFLPLIGYDKVYDFQRKSLKDPSTPVTLGKPDCKVINLMWKNLLMIPFGNLPVPLHSESNKFAPQFINSLCSHLGHSCNPKSWSHILKTIVDWHLLLLNPSKKAKS